MDQWPAIADPATAPLMPVESPVSGRTAPKGHGRSPAKGCPAELAAKEGRASTPVGPIELLLRAQKNDVVGIQTLIRKGVSPK